MRKRYRQIGLELVEVSDDCDRVPHGTLIVPDLEPFKSPVDGSTITGRASLRAHNKRNNVTFADDFKDHWAQKRGERDEFYSGANKRDKQERIEAIKHAIEAHR